MVVTVAVAVAAAAAAAAAALGLTSCRMRELNYKQAKQKSRKQERVTDWETPEASGFGPNLLRCCVLLLGVWGENLNCIRRARAPPKLKFR